MKNLTLAIDEALLQRARIYAAKHDTTVNSLVRQHLEQLVKHEAAPGSARDRLLKLIDESPGRLGPDWKWNREDAYEGRVLPRHQHPHLRRSREDR